MDGPSQGHKCQGDLVVPCAPGFPLHRKTPSGDGQCERRRSLKDMGSFRRGGTPAPAHHGLSSHACASSNAGFISLTNEHRVLYCLCCLCSSEKHYLHYMFTVLTKADLFPEFTVVGVVDDRLISDYSIEVPDWTRLILMEDYGVMTLVQSCDSADWFMDQVHILSNCTNCSELHTLQRIVGCEVEKFPNGTVKSLNVFDEYGFDGEDLIAFENDTMLWIVKSPKAKEMKKKWDLQIGRNQFIKDYFGKCMEWILTFNNTHKDSPEVYISARRDPDDHTKLNLSCLTTSFYPRDIEMNIRLNESVLDNQTSSEIRPNANKTFQMRTSVKIDINSQGYYDCFVIHSSLTEPASVEWDGTCSTFETESDQTFIVILSVSAS
ncbi:zinc-alpha-2-glycoprotein-like [Carassius carassius]|uniref:zinc-alpha-2-glycoprotein-like n=1 Tax=Carassius carassius TaxID=217509 RepID=UPI0028692BC5|nr:zinc-alpha-2-glycoprotein-like [Carassius carassius]